MGISYFLYIKYDKESKNKSYDFFTNNGFIINRNINDMFFNTNIEQNNLMESNIDESIKIDDNLNKNNIVNTVNDNSDENLLVDI